MDLPYVAIEDRIVGHSRWSVDHEIIFKYEGRFWRTTYSVAATESQDESPWQYQNMVECQEVRQQEVTRLEWIEVDG